MRSVRMDYSVNCYIISMFTHTYCKQLGKEIKDEF